MKVRLPPAALVGLAVVVMMADAGMMPNEPISGAASVAENILANMMGGGGMGDMGGHGGGDNTLGGGPGGPNLPDVPGGIDQFTVMDVDRMLKGMVDGLRYNYQGQEATAGEVTFKERELEQLMLLLQMQGGAGSMDMGPGAGGSMDMGTGDNPDLSMGANIDLGTGGNMDLGAGGNMDLGAGSNFDAGPAGGIDMGAGGSPDLGMGGNLNLGASGNVDLGAGGSVNMDSGGNVDSGSVGMSVDAGTGMDAGAAVDALDALLGGGVNMGLDGGVDMGIAGGPDPFIGGGVDMGVGGGADMGVGGGVDMGVGGIVDPIVGGDVDIGVGGVGDMGVGGGADPVLGGDVDMGAGESVNAGASGTVDTGAGGGADLGVAAGGDILPGAIAGNADLGAGVSVDMGAGGSVDSNTGGSVDGSVEMGTGPDPAPAEGTGLVMTADFTLTDVLRMIAGMQQNLRFNYQGFEAGEGDDVLTMPQLTALLDELRPQHAAAAGSTDGQGSAPVDGQGTSGADGQGTATADGQAPPAPDGQAPPASDGQAPPASDGQAPPASDGQAPPASDGQAPPAPDSQAPPASDGQAPPAPDGQAPPAPDSQAPPAPDSQAPPAPDSQGQPPADGPVQPPADGQGSLPAEGQGTSPTDGQDPSPAVDQGPPPADGQGSQPADVPPPTVGQDPPSADVQGPPPTDGQGLPTDAGGQGPDMGGDLPTGGAAEAAATQPEVPTNVEGGPAPPEPVLPSVPIIPTPAPPKPPTMPILPPMGPDMLPGIGKDENMVDINPVVSGEVPVGSGPFQPPTGQGQTPGDGSLAGQSHFSPTGEFLGPLGPEWLKARIDPAPCREWKCNLPICYVPHVNDCKSYIVCQRTAIGTYVAWRMRCAFGSYWGTGELWTCERVEELANKGYTCPNDPCRDTSLSVYADSDDDNCRTYWQCEAGISKPTCCPQGTMFDRGTLRCVDDPFERCRAPCPLKIEGCSLPGARTMPFYDGNCRTYWDCENGHPYPVCCDLGMSYDSSRGTCITDPRCQDYCPSDYVGGCGKLNPDGTPVASYKLSTDDNCRTFMKCNPKGYTDAFCCRQEHTYNNQTGHCERVEDPLDACNVAECPQGFKEECRFTSVPGFPKRFFDTDAGIERDCAPGTAFVEEICTCDGNSVAETCKKEVWAKFDELQDKWSVKNYGDGWISVFGRMQKNQSNEGITYGTFDGSSGMEVWRYDHAAFAAVTLRITFQPVDSGSFKQVLISNCRSVEDDLPSFEVTVNPDTSMIEFTGISKFDTAVLGVRYNKMGWNTFTLLYDGQNVLAKIEDPAALGQADQTFAPLRGDIIAGQGSLKFGPCLDGNSQPMSNGFTGFVSEVVFSKCVDKDSKDEINNMISNGNGVRRGPP